MALYLKIAIPSYFGHSICFKEILALFRKIYLQNFWSFFCEKTNNFFVQIALVLFIQNQHANHVLHVFTSMFGAYFGTYLIFLNVKFDLHTLHLTVYPTKWRVGPDFFLCKLRLLVYFLIVCVFYPAICSIIPLYRSLHFWRPRFC